MTKCEKGDCPNGIDDKLALLLDSNKELLESNKALCDKISELDKKIFYPGGIIQSSDKMDSRIAVLEKESNQKQETRTRLIWLIIGVFFSSPVLSFILMHIWR